MLSLTLNTLSHFPHYATTKPARLRPAASVSLSALSPSASLIPANPPPPQQQNLYQPFRPPPSPLPPQFRGLDTKGRLDVLFNRLGLWFDYAPLIPTLVQDGFTPSSLEEVTGISGVEQNRLVVAAQVRDTLIASKTPPEVVSAFDLGGAELLYEIRLLSTQQRSAAASFIVAKGLDAKAVQELARSVKDFPRRKGDRGWESFDYNLPGDCLAFMHFRQSREHKNPSEQRTSALEQALAAAESEAARGRISDELRAGSGGEAEDGTALEGTRVPVVRLKIGEVAEARKVVVLPVVRAAAGERLEDAPRECRTEGEFGVVVAERGWQRWVVLPGWDPVVGLGGGGAVVAFGDARALPWRANRWYKEEAILVVVDRDRTAVEAEDGFYLVAAAAGGGGGDGGLKVVRGSEVGAAEILGAVVLVVRPPRDEADDELADEDWE